VIDSLVSGEARLQVLVDVAVGAFVAAGALLRWSRPQKTHLLEASPDRILLSGWRHGWSETPLVSRYQGFGRVVRWAGVACTVAGVGLLAATFWVVSYDVPNPGLTMLLLVAGALLALVCLVLPIVAVVVVLRRNRQGRRGDRTHGTARWHPIRREWWNPTEAVAASLVIRPDTPEAADGLAPWTAKDVTLAHFTWAQLSRHMLLVGASGSGKTRSLYYHLMISSRVPWIYQDQKAELPLRDRFPERPVWGLDTPKYRSRSGVWNPMEEVRNAEDLAVVAALLFPDKGDMNDWVVREARMLFDAMWKEWHFESLQQYIYMLQHTPIEQIIEYLPAGYTTALADARTRAYCMGEIMTALRPYINTARIAAITSGRSTVTLDDFITRGGYVLCNEDAHLRQPVTLFWGMLLHRLRNRSTEESYPLLLLMDEFGDAGRIPNMAQALALYRGKGVGIIAGIQSLSLLESVYGETEWKAIRDGFGTQMILTANLTPELQVAMTQQLGNFTMEHSQNSATFGTGFNVSATIGAPSRTAAALVPVDQWGYWSEHHAVIVRGAKGPTWWIPLEVDLPPSPLGEKLLADPEEDWRLTERKRMRIFAESMSSTLPKAGEALVPQPRLVPPRD